MTWIVRGVNLELAFAGLIALIVVGGGGLVVLVSEDAAMVLGALVYALAGGV